MSDSWIHDLKMGVDRLPTAAASPELLKRVHERLAANEHVILPLADPPVAQLRWRVAAAIGLVLAAGAGLWFAWPTATLTAGDIQGELTFVPAAPRRGQPIEVSYQAPATLQRRDRLVLRARYRSRHDQSYNNETRQIVVGELRPAGDGVFHATLTLPDSVVYAVFAVEDLEGQTVDANRRRLWELVLHDSLGRPTFEALRQRENDLMGRNWELGYETARQAAALYPDRVESWSTLLFYEENVLGGAYLDSARANHHARLNAFHRRLASRAVLSADELGFMFWYALQVRDSALEKHWRERLQREAPASPFAVQNRALAIANRAWQDKDSLRALADLDRLWDEAGPAHGNLLVIGWQTALHVADSAAVVRWAGHWRPRDPADSTAIATAFTSVPGLREEGMRLLRQQLGGLAARNDERRALERTVVEQRVVDAERTREVLVALGEALLASGHTAAGLDTLKLAVRDGWDVGLFRRVARLERSTGDTAGALRLLALVAADPAMDGWTRDSAAQVMGTRVDSAAWSQLVESGRNEMRRRLLEVAMSRRIPPGVRLEAAGNLTVPLDTLRRGRVTFVAFWSRYCGPSKEELPALERVTARLRREGISVVTITTDERLTGGLQQFLKNEKLSFPVYADAWRDASRAFSQWGTPLYFVLDRDGIIRFAYRDLSRIPAEVAVLQ